MRKVAVLLGAAALAGTTMLGMAQADAAKAPNFATGSVVCDLEGTIELSGVVKHNPRLARPVSASLKSKKGSCAGDVHGLPAGVGIDVARVSSRFTLNSQTTCANAPELALYAGKGIRTHVVWSDKVGTTAKGKDLVRAVTASVVRKEAGTASLLPSVDLGRSVGAFGDHDMTLALDPESLQVDCARRTMAFKGTLTVQP